jgi:hypothetical protein
VCSLEADERDENYDTELQELEADYNSAAKALDDLEKHAGVRLAACINPIITRGILLMQTEVRTGIVSAVGLYCTLINGVLPNANATDSTVAPVLAILLGDRGKLQATPTACPAPPRSATSQQLCCTRNNVTY